MGVQYKVPDLQKQLLSSDRHLFAKVSSQIDWIVDTMSKCVARFFDRSNQRKTDKIGNNDTDDFESHLPLSELCSAGFCMKCNNSNSPILFSTTPPLPLKILRSFCLDPKSFNLHLEDANNNSNEPGLNPRSDSLPGADASQTCNKFRCSSGECLSWSRICDGLYDCSSQDDEKDCHK